MDIVALIFIAVVLGLVPATIAHLKGHSFLSWWATGAVFFPLAFPHSLFVKRNRSELERRKLSRGDAQRCPHCAELIRPEANVCRHCGRDVAALVPAPALPGA